jgi:hypothetical protein
LREAGYYPEQEVAVYVASVIDEFMGRQLGPEHPRSWATLGSEFHGTLYHDTIETFLS